MAVSAVSETTSVAIGVPTYKRPAALALLVPRLLEQADELSAHEVRLVVVDNDPRGSAQAVCEAVADPRLRYVLEPTPGIAAVRNRILDEAGDAGLVAMIDDDELPEPRWLSALVDTWRQTRSALVAGRVVAAFAGELDPWLAAGRFFDRRNLPTGSPISVAAAGNLLLDLRQIRAFGLRFDERLGLGGGEDTLFTRQLHALGGQMVWCAESVIVDQVPLSRMTRRWVLARARSQGHAGARGELLLAGSSRARLRVRVRVALGGLLRVVSGSGRAASGIALVRRGDQARGLRTAMRGMGMLTAALGLEHQEYARPSGADHLRA